MNGIKIITKVEDQIGTEGQNKKNIYWSKKKNNEEENKNTELVEQLEYKYYGIRLW